MCWFKDWLSSLLMFRVYALWIKFSPLLFYFLYLRDVSWGSAVGIATAYRLDDQGVGVEVPEGSRIFSSPHCPDRLWGSPSLLFNGYRELFPRG
jgi:hypothetical protein